MAMEDQPEPVELICATVEEVAEWLSFAEGREVTIHEVRRIEAQAQALRKLRQILQGSGLNPADLLPEGFSQSPARFKTV